MLVVVVLAVTQLGVMVALAVAVLVLHIPTYLRMVEPIWAVVVAEVVSQIQVQVFRLLEVVMAVLVL
jgi:hypothetical protein